MLRKAKSLVFDPKIIYRAIDEIAPVLAQEYADTLIRNIQTNKFGNTNAKSTLNKKEGDIPLIASGELLSAIVVERTIVKMKKGTHSSGLSYEELMSILEYGRLDKHILPFNVWRRTKEEFEPRAKEIIEDKLKTLYKKKR